VLLFLGSLSILRLFAADRGFSDVKPAQNSPALRKSQNLKSQIENRTAAFAAAFDFRTRPY
jgi:hypothetical protein